MRGQEVLHRPRARARVCVPVPIPGREERRHPPALAPAPAQLQHYDSTRSNLRTPAPALPGRYLRPDHSVLVSPPLIMPRPPTPSPIAAPVAPPAALATITPTPISCSESLSDALLVGMVPGGWDGAHRRQQGSVHAGTQAVFQNFPILIHQLPHIVTERCPSIR